MASSDPKEDLSELLGTLSRKQLADLLAESLPRDQIAGILLSAANADPSTRSNIHRAADAEISHRILLVAGLGADATADSLRRCFSPFGEVEKVGIPVDVDGRSKDYGFVMFRHLASAKKALEEPRKPIDGGPTTVFCSYTESARKIYVQNLPRDLGGFTRVIEFFRQFGEVEEVKRIIEEAGTVYLVYKTLEGAVRASEEPRKNFEGRILECEKEKLGGRTAPQPAPRARGTAPRARGKRALGTAPRARGKRARGGADEG